MRGHVPRPLCLTIWRRCGDPAFMWKPRPCFSGAGRTRFFPRPAGWPTSPRRYLFRSCVSYPLDRPPWNWSRACGKPRPCVGICDVTWISSISSTPPGTTELHLLCPDCGRILAYREFYGPMGARTVACQPEMTCSCGSRTPDKGVKSDGRLIMRTA